MNVLNDIKKDIEQIRETGKKLEKKAPLATAVAKSTSIIIKWIIIAIVVFSIIILVIIFLPKEKKEEITYQPFSSKYEYQTLPITVNSLRWSLEDVYNLGKAIKPSKGSPVVTTYQTTGKFIEVIIIVENKGISSIWSPEELKFRTKDDKGRNYEEIGRTLSHKYYSSIDLGEYSRKEVKPGVSYKFSVFFEVATDSETFYVLVGQKELKQ